MKKKIINLFIIFILFSNILFSNISLPEFFNWWDVLFELVLLAFFLWNLCNNRNLKLKKEYWICYILLLIIILIGIIGDIIFKYYNSTYAIFKDILSFLKFPLTFLLIKNLNLDAKVSELLDEKFFYILKVLIVIILVLGVLSLFVDIGMSMEEYRHGIRPYRFLFSHSTFLVINMIFILSLFEYKKNLIKNYIIFEFLILAILLLTMRTKAFAFVGAFIIIKFFEKTLIKHKKIFFIIIFLILFSTAYSKLALYASFSSSTREVLYKGCETLIVKCFPVGSGFATYASHISGEYVSKVYDFIPVNYVFESQNLAQLGDVGFPYYIGQFGILGCVCILFLVSNIIKICLKDNNNKLATYILLLYILIGMTTESTLLNFGLEIAIILATVSTKIKIEEK